MYLKNYYKKNTLPLIVVARIMNDFYKHCHIITDTPNI